MRDELPPPDGDDDGAALGSFEDGAWRDAPGSVERRSQQKRRLLERALELGKTMVRLDPRRPGCVVPPRFEQDPQLAVNLSWRFPDTRMVVNERGVAATLRFGGIPMRLVVPWHALWAIAEPGADELRLWPVDVPEEFGGPPRQWEGFVAPPVESRRPSLSVVSDSIVVPDDAPAGRTSIGLSRNSDAPSPPPPVAEPAPTADASALASRPPWLRLVK